MKASFTLNPAIDKALNIVALIGVMAWVLYPTIIQAEHSLQNSGEQALVFEVKNLPTSEIAVDSENTDQNLSNKPQVQLASLSYQELLGANIGQITQDAYKEQLRNYLTQRGSPFAQCVDLLVTLPTSDKILSLSNAESGLGTNVSAIRRSYNNYWGIGGTRPWKMGNNVCEGIQSMDNFLHEYPRASAVKYKDMSIVDMCGVYKQPCPGKGKHYWVGNNNKILTQLAALKGEAQKIAQEKVNAGNQLTIATTEIDLK